MVGPSKNYPSFRLRVGITPPRSTMLRRQDAGLHGLSQRRLHPSEEIR